MPGVRIISRGQHVAAPSAMQRLRKGGVDMQGITPTFTFELEDSVDLTTADNVYCTFRQGMQKITKTGSDVTTTATTVSVFLSQAETLSFAEADVEVEVNWTYSNGLRGKSEIVKIPWGRTLEKRVLE